MKTFKAVVTLTGNNHGFIGNRRVYDGDIIDVTDAQYSDKWMRRIRKEREAKEPEPTPVKPSFLKV